MGAIGTAALFLPEDLMVLVIAASGMCMIVGARKAAASLFMFAIASLVLPVVLEPIVQMVPVWVLWIGLAYLVFLVPFASVRLFGSLTQPALGKRATDDMVGHLARDVAVSMLSAPFVLLRWIFRALGGAARYIVRSLE